MEGERKTRGPGEVKIRPESICTSDARLARLEDIWIKKDIKKMRQWLAL